MRFVITIAHKKHDVFLNWFRFFKIFIKTYTTAGFTALERGGRINNLHVQATIGIRNNIDKASCNQLRAFIRVICPIPPGLDSVIGVTPLIGHDWEATTGYCQKDTDQPHYDSEAHNMSQNFLQHCNQKYTGLSTTHEKDKELITLHNMFKKIFSYKQ